MISNVVKSLLFLLLCGAGSCAVLEWEDPAGPLFLTPYILNGQTEAGREAAKVTPLVGDVESYSGFLTVDEKLNKNLFFWYFPAEKKSTEQEIVDYKTDVSCINGVCVYHHETSQIIIERPVEDKTPVILWLQGGPGASSMYGLLEENGPYQLMDDLSLKLREHRWSKSFHMLYIDNPVGTGFSFAGPGVYDTNETVVSQDLYNALLQFFELFPDLDGNEFFIAGESYAGRYVPALGLHIHEMNLIAAERINLVGLLIGDGVVDNEFMVYGDYLAQHGLIDLLDLPGWQKDEERYREALREKDYQTASELILNFQNKMIKTGVSPYNFLETKAFDINLLTEFFNEEVKQKIHVGDRTFNPQNDLVNKMLWAGDFFMETSYYTEKLLENYRVMHYNGQLDIICHYPMAEAYTNSLQWSGSAEFQGADKNEWVVGQAVAGYVKSGGNLYLVMVRDAGHMVPKDQPEWAFDLVTKFVNNNW